jgi:hypothetical protein
MTVKQLDALAAVLVANTPGMDRNGYVHLCYRIADALLLPAPKRARFLTRCDAA